MAEVKIDIVAQDSASDEFADIRREMSGMQKDVAGLSQKLNTSLTGGLKGVQAALESDNKHIKIAKDELKKLGIGATAAAVAFAAFARQSVMAASDMNETISKTEVIFGDSSQAVIDFAETSATAFGQSKQQALDAASTFAVFGKAAGLAGNELVSFSTDLTGLSSDLSSFYNTSPEDAILAIGAALRGESEPIRRYGVLLDDATLKQKAMEMGLISTTKNALTPQQRALAAYQVILSQTTDAQGDFARTSDGLANQMRIFDAQLTNIKTNLGTGFLPIVLKVVSGLNDYLSESIRVEMAQKNLDKAYEAGIITLWEKGRAIEKMRWTEDGLIETEDMLNKKLGIGVVETGRMANAMREAAQAASEGDLSGYTEDTEALALAAGDAAAKTEAMRYAIINLDKAYLAREAIDALSKAVDEHTISAEEARARTAMIMTQWLEMPAAEVEAAMALQDLKRNAEEGSATWWDYYNAIGGTKSYMESMNGKKYTTYFELVTTGTNYHYTPPSGGTTTTTGGNSKPEYRAGGGSISGGSPYIVGERGPELFIPQNSGQVMNNAQTTQMMAIDYKKMARAFRDELQKVQ